MKKVLICDDATFMRHTIKTALERNGFEVVGEAQNGRIALAKYKELMPNVDLVTMDITMPELDGIETTKALKALDPNVKIIIVSAMGQETYVREAIMSGAKDYIVKPFKEELIIEKIKKIVQ